MKNPIAIVLLAGVLAAPTASLWAAAGDATQQGANGTVTGTAPVAKTKKGHHHHKKASSTTPTPAGTSAPVTK